MTLHENMNTTFHNSYEVQQIFLNDVFWNFT